MSRRFPPELHEFLRSYIPGHTTRDICAEAQRRFGIELTESSVKSYKKNNGIPSGTSCGVPAGRPTELYPAEVQSFIAEHCRGTSPKEMCERLRTETGREYTERQLRAYYKNHGLVSGIDTRYKPGNVPYNSGRKGMTVHPNTAEAQFRAGHIPVNRMPIGTVRKKADGYLWKKLGEGRRDWKQLHLLLWEEVNGAVPDGMKLTFLNGNREDVRLENLALVSNDVNLEMNRQRLRFDDAELTRTGAALAELNVAINRQKRKIKKGEKCK